MNQAATFYGFRRWTSNVLLGILAVAIAAFGAADRWVWTLIAIAVLGMTATWARRRWSKPFPFVWTWFYLPLGLLIGGAFLQVLSGWTADRFATADSLAFWITMLAWLALWVNALEDTSIRYSLVRALPWLGAAVSALAIIQHYTLPFAAYWFREAPGAAVFGMFANRNHFVILIELLFPGALFLALTDFGRHQVRHLALCMTMVFAVFISGAQAGFFLLLAESSVALLFHLVLAIRSRSRKRRARMLLSGAAFIVIAGFLLLVTRSYRTVRPDETLMERLARDRIVEGMSRSVAAQGSWAMFAAKPVLGHGAGAFGTAYAEFAPDQDGNFWNHALSDPLELAAELGMLGVGAQVLVLLFAVGRARRAQVWVTSILPLGVAWTHSLTEFPLQTPALPMTALVLLALIPTDGGVAVRGGRGMPRRPAPTAGEEVAAPAST